MVALSRYEKIACDVAEKIVQGTYKVGERLRGRSTLAGLYKVSPETMRKAFALLSTQGVVEVKHGSGVYVVSVEKARQFLDNVARKPRLKAKLEELSGLIAKRRDIDRRIESCIAEISQFVSERADSDSELETQWEQE